MEDIGKSILEGQFFFLRTLISFIHSNDVVNNLWLVLRYVLHI